MRKSSLWISGLILLLAVFVTYLALPSKPFNTIAGINLNPPLKQGLDLQGGVQFVLRAQCPDSNKNCNIDQNLDSTIQNINTRINGGLGVSEAVVVSQKDPVSGYTYVSVELPGVKDPQEALSIVGNTGNLEIIDTGSTYLQAGTAVTEGQYPIRFTGRDLDPNAISVGFDDANQPIIQFAMQGSSKDKFADYTQKNIGNYLTITLDNKVISSATIQSQITGPGQISGSFTLAEAQNISTLMKYGALPLTLTLQTEKQISPTLGAQAIFDSIRAAIIGLGLVILFMLIYYRLPGALAAIALALYAALMLSIIKILGAVMTLAGIAGLILAIGMAVDANVLIFERIKEELRGGRTLASAIDIGWHRAWPSIRDSNASTIITCLILAFFGNNFGATVIVGFATNLLIGVVTSLFTAVVVTRTLLNDLVRVWPGVVNHPALFGLPKEAITVPTYRRPARQGSGSPRLALASQNGDADLDDDGEE